MEDTKKLAELLLEADVAPPDSNGRVYRRSADGHNRDRSRGVPIIRRGIGCTSPGTQPEAALLAKEARGELRL